MAINVRKSAIACIRFGPGPRYKNACVDIVASGHSMKWEMSARYLGVCLESSAKFKFSFFQKQSGILKGHFTHMKLFFKITEIETLINITYIVRFLRSTDVSVFYY